MDIQLQRLLGSNSPVGYFMLQVQKGTTNPAFKERFLYSVEPDAVDRQMVQFQVFSCDRYARHKLLGETEIRLGDISLKQSIRIWMNLRDMDEVKTQ